MWSPESVRYSGVWSFLRHPLDVGRDGGGEEQRLPLLRERVEDGGHLALEAHREHLVRLVEDEEADVVRVERAAPEVVEHAARRAHHHLRALGELVDLPLHRGAAVHGRDLDVAALAQPLDLGRDLEGQLARRAEGEHLDLGHRAADDVVHDRQAEGRRLARPGARLHHRVLAARGGLPHRDLHRRGVGVANLGEGLADFAGEREDVEGRPRGRAGFGALGGGRGGCGGRGQVRHGEDSVRASRGVGSAGWDSRARLRARLGMAPEWVGRGSGGVAPSWSAAELAVDDGLDFAAERRKLPGFASDGVLLRIAEPLDGVECGGVASPRRRAHAPRRHPVPVRPLGLEGAAEAGERRVLSPPAPAAASRARATASKRARSPSWQLAYGGVGVGTK